MNDRESLFTCPSCGYGEFADEVGVVVCEDCGATIETRPNKHRLLVADESLTCAFPWRSAPVADRRLAAVWARRLNAMAKRGISTRTLTPGECAEVAALLSRQEDALRDIAVIKPDSIQWVEANYERLNKAVCLAREALK